LEGPRQATVPLTRIQKLTGERMLLSKRTKPCFYLQRNADVTELMADRHALSKRLGVKITSNAFLIRALAVAAARYPLMLAVLTKTAGEGIATVPSAVHVGFAVNSPQGLMVPVVRQAHELPLAPIAEQEQSLTRKARSNRLTLDDIEGETIALSNLGAYDIHSFVAIVPPAVSTILAVGNVIHAAVPAAGSVEARKLMSLTLAVDGRIVTPPYAAEFLGAVAELLQNPERLL
jgi:pyruvate dehydrogenase E2 component (dihydrolipoamide acetyltransferase)